jgi:cell division initiation protein
MSPHAIRTASFASARHGLDEREVRRLLERLAAQVEAADADRAALRSEAAELRQQVDGLRASQPDEERIRTEISVRAVDLLSRAQQAADDAVAEAEQYARDLVMTAREQYREVLHKAQEAAGGVAQAVAGVGQTPSSPGLSYTHPVPEVEYVRTFAQVAASQLKSVLDALTTEVDKLGHLPLVSSGDSTGQHAAVDVRAVEQPEQQALDAPRSRWLSGLPNASVSDPAAS